MSTTIVDKLKSDKTLYTNADELGEIVGLNHNLINQVIRRHQQELESVSREPLHHRPIGRYKKVYLLNRQQLLMTLVFMQSNDRVSAVATELIRIICKSPEVIRDEQTKELNKQFRSAIRANDTRVKLDYNKYYELAYRLGTGQNCKQLRDTLAIPDGKTITDFLSDELVERVNKSKLEIIEQLRQGRSFNNIVITLMTK